MDEKCILDPSRDCLGLEKARMLEKQVDEYRRQAREDHSKIYTRLEEMEELKALAREKAKPQYNVNEDLTKILVEINDLKKRIEALENNISEPTPPQLKMSILITRPENGIIKIIR